MLKIRSISNGNVYLEGDVNVMNNEVIHSKEDNEGTLFVKNTNIEGIFNYGYKTKFADPVWDKPAGYVWSSRASVMNKTFGLKLLDVTYNYCSVAIDLAHLEALLVDTEYEIDWEPLIKDEDVVYKLKKKSV